MRTSLLSVIFGIPAFLCGNRALGYSAILHFGGLRPSQRGEIVLMVASSVLLFLAVSFLSACVRERSHGARAVFARTLYLIGIYGLPPISLFTIVSRGQVLQIPEVAALLVLFPCLILVCRPAHTRPHGLVSI